MVKPTSTMSLTQSLAWGRHSSAQRLGHPPHTSPPSLSPTPENGLVTWGLCRVSSLLSDPIAFLGCLTSLPSTAPTRSAPPRSAPRVGNASGVSRGCCWLGPKPRGLQNRGLNAARTAGL